MVPSWTVTLSYVAYAVVLAIGALCWLGALAEVVIYRRVDVGLLDPGWEEAALWLARNLRYGVLAGVLCTAAALVAVLLPAAEATPAQSEIVQAHRGYLLRYGAIAVLLLGLVYLAEGRMGEFDAEVVAAAVFAWALWCLLAGWWALADASPVDAPPLWWLALAADLLAIAAITAFVIAFSRSGFRMF
jgi:hypothetical protein